MGETHLTEGVECFTLVVEILCSGELVAVLPSHADASDATRRKYRLEDPDPAAQEDKDSA